MTSDDIPALRAAVAALAERHGKQLVARESGVNPDTLYRFLAGEDLTKRTRIRLAEYARAAARATPLGTSETVGVRAEVAPPPVTPGELLPGYWIGRVAEIGDALEATLRRLRAFEAAGPRWEAATALASMGLSPATAPAAPAPALIIPLVSGQPAMTAEELAAHQAAHEAETDAIIARREREEREAREQAERDAERRRAAGGQ